MDAGTNLAGKNHTLQTGFKMLQQDVSDTTIRRPLQWSTSADTNVGMVRDINEDSIIADPDSGIWAVADGMGGYEAGEIASNMLVSSLNEVQEHKHLHSLVDEVEDRIIDANNRILEYADIMHNGRIIGSTLVSLVIKGQAGVCLWAGDSRLYRLRNGKLEQVSRDHSHVQELIDQGVISKEEAEKHPDSNVITRAVGTSRDIYIDMIAFDIQKGDTYLLCSDGLYNTVPDQLIGHYMNEPDTDDAVKQLIVHSLENGAPDNVSVIIVKNQSGFENSH